MPAPAAATPPADPRTLYAARRDAFEAARAAEASRSLRMSGMRAATFAGALAFGVLAEVRPGVLPLVAAFLCVAAFIALVVAHNRIRASEKRLTVLRDLNEEGIRRLDRDWSQLPVQQPAHALPDFATDLDLFGSPGLTQLLGPTGTPAGAATLASWLLQPAAPDVLRARQSTARDLAQRNDFRDDFAAEPRLHAGANAEDVERFLSWAEGDTWLAQRPWLARARWLLPIASIALIALDIATRGGPALWVIPVSIALWITLRPGESVRKRFGHVFGREGLLRAYPRLLQLATSLDSDDPSVRALRARFDAGGIDAVTWLHKLARLEHLANLRLSGLMYAPVQILLLWDLHVLAALERWQQQAGPHVRTWLDALGELESLCAIATLTHDHPDWCWPNIDPAADRFEAESLGHPMIAEDARVANDVAVGPPGTFLLITGSNMSGKSTLLRAIGTNAVLAQAGAPVCARRLRMPPVRLGTSIHVHDSLVQGTSYFMAQLEHMKRVVQAATAGGPMLLYLLDEMLQGTNTAERRIAATVVLRHLIDAGAIGAVTTHDLELAQEPELVPAMRPVHFTETVVREEGRDALVFDYVLRPGVATSTNALKLMEIVGLSAPKPSSPS